jgi:hypothetical protein
MLERSQYKTGVPLTSHDQHGRSIDPALYDAKVMVAKQAPVHLSVGNKRVEMLISKGKS